MSRLIRIVMMRRVHPPTDQRGMILVVTLMLVLMLALLGSAILTTSGTEHQIAKNDQEVTQAFYVAEGGLQTAINQVNQGLAVSTSGAIGPGQFTVTVTSASPPLGQQRIEAVGYVPTQASPRAAKKLAALICCGSRFQWAAFADVAIGMGGSMALVDSYDSAIAPYNAATAGSEGNLRTNGDIILNNSTVVKGDAIAGGTVKNSDGVTGTVTTGAPHIDPPPTVACPSGGYTPNSSVPSGAGISYNQNTGKLVVSGGHNLTLNAPPTTYYFSEVSLTGGSTLTLNTGGQHVDLYISELLDVGGGGIANTSTYPTRLTIWECGTPTTNKNWVINGGSQAYFALYAPDKLVKLGGGGDFWGALIAGELDSTGGSRIHYDEALARQSGSSKFAIVRGSWTELLM